ncbi:MAG: glycosyltransferase, partial [Burkholderiales bacterium]
MSAHDSPLLVAHVVYRFDVGGLENGVVNLLNRLPYERFRHAVIALTEVTEFRRRVQRDDVQYLALNKRPGHGAKLWPALYRAFRALRPDIVHTRNLAPLEACVPAWFAGVPVRVHGEHGWDVGD